MFSSTKSLNVAALLALVVLLACEKKAEKPSPSPSSAPAVVGKPTAEQIAAYPLDVCVIAGEKLGDHGDPYDMLFEGRLVRLCCKSCEDDFKAEPAKYLAKIDEAAKSKPPTE